MTEAWAIDYRNYILRRFSKGVSYTEFLPSDTGLTGKLQAGETSTAIELGW